MTLVDSGIMDLIAVKLHLVAAAHFKATHLVVGAGTLHLIANDSPACTARSMACVPPMIWSCEITQ